MKTNNILVMLFILISMTSCFNIASAQNNKKKPVNIGINISNSSDSIKTTNFSVGIINNVYKLNGVGIDFISHKASTYMNGMQFSGIVNSVGLNAKGLQIAGITNIVGIHQSGIMFSGLMNISGISANGIQASLFGNIAGSDIRGITMGGLVNINGQNASGLQLSCITNISGGNQNGLAFSGLLNVSGRYMSGAQISGLLNINGKKVRGFQLSGLGNVAVDMNGLQTSLISNITVNKLNGVQISPISNIAVNSEKAMQLSGMLNVCQDETKALQFAPVNYAGSLKGMQLGLFNISDINSNGLQLGIVNYSKDSTTTKIGFVNVTPQTKKQLLIYGSNTSKFNLAIRFKNKLKYSMLGIGTHYLGLSNKFSGELFYRTGLHYQLAKRLDISGDLGYFHIESFENKNSTTPERLYSLEGRVNLEYQIYKKFALYASGGYGVTRYYDKNKTFNEKPIFGVGVILF